MAFNAGEIEATATIDRAPFNAGLDQMKADAKAFADKKYSASADVDISKAQTKIALLNRQIAQNRKIVIDTQTASANVDKLNKSLGQTSKSADDAKSHINPLITSIITLGPALIPLSGGIAGIGAGLFGLGAVGLVAFKGIQTQMAANTKTGLQYSASILGLKNSLSGIEAIAARGLLSGFQSGVAKLNQDVPQLNAFVGKLSTILGNIGSSVIGAVVTGFNTFTPLIEQSATYIEQLASGFEKWAQGPGGQQFMSTISQDFTTALPIIGELLDLTTRLITSLEPIGNVVLTGIGAFAKILDSFPMPVLTAITTAFVAWKIASTIGVGINLLSTSLAGLTGAQLAVAGSAAKAALAEDALVASIRAASVASLSGAAGGTLLAASNTANAVGGASEAIPGAASAGLAGRAAAGASGILATVAPIAVAYAGITIAVSAAANATKKWADSTSTAAREANFDLQGTKDILTLHFGAFGSLIDSTNKETKYLDDYKSNVKDVNTVLSTLNSTTGLSKTEFDGQTDAVANLTNGQKVLASSVSACVTATGQLTNAQIIATAKASSYADSMKIVSQQTRIATQQINAGPISQAASSFQTLQGAVQGNVNALLSNVTAGQHVVYTYQGIKVGSDAYSAALEKTNGNVDKAIGLLNGQIDAIHTQQTAINGQIVSQQRLNTYVSDAEDKYHLTSAQVDLYSAALGLNAAAIDKSNASETAAEQSLGTFVTELGNGNTAVNDLVTALGNYQTAGATAASTGALIGAALKDSNGDALNYANTMNQAAVANQNLVTGFTKAVKGTVDLKTGVIDFTNAAAAPLLNSLNQLQTAAENNAAATYQHELSIKGQTQAAKDAVNVYTSETSGALEGEYKQLGLTAGQAKALATQYLNTPKSVITQIEQNGADGVTNILKGMLTDLAAIAKHFAPTVTIDPTQALYSISQIQGALAALPGNAPAGERQGVQKILEQTKGTTTVTGANGMLLSKYANGGMENHQPFIYKTAPNTVRVFAEPETGGEAYIPLANDYRRPRAQAIAATTVHLLGGVAKFAQGNPSLGFDGVTAGPLGTGINTNTNSGTTIASVSTKVITAAAKAEENAISALLTTITAESKYSAAQIISNMTTIIKSFVQAKALGETTSTVVGAVTRQAAALNIVTKSLATTTAQLATARANFAQLGQNASAYASSAASTSFGVFDPGTSGQGYSAGILTDLKTDYANQGQFNTLLAKAKALGYSSQILAQIASEGPATAGKNLQALVTAGSASKSYVSQVNAYDTALQGRSDATGAIAANDKYGAQIAAGQAQIRALAAQQLAEQKSQAADVKALLAELKALDAKLTNAKRAGVK